MRTAEGQEYDWYFPRLLRPGEPHGLPHRPRPLPGRGHHPGGAVPDAAALADGVALRGRRRLLGVRHRVRSLHVRGLGWSGVAQASSSSSAAPRPSPTSTRSSSGPWAQLCAHGSHHPATLRISSPQRTRSGSRVHTDLAPPPGNHPSPHRQLRRACRRRHQPGLSPSAGHRTRSRILGGRCAAVSSRRSVYGLEVLPRTPVRVARSRATPDDQHRPCGRESCSLAAALPALGVDSDRRDRRVWSGGRPASHDVLACGGDPSGPQRPRHVAPPDRKPPRAGRGADDGRPSGRWSGRGWRPLADGRCPRRCRHDLTTDRPAHPPVLIRTRTGPTQSAARTRAGTHHERVHRST